MYDKETKMKVSKYSKSAVPNSRSSIYFKDLKTFINGVVTMRLMTNTLLNQLVSLDILGLIIMMLLCFKRM